MTNKACPTTQKTAQGVPEVALWRAVILTLLSDLISGREYDSSAAHQWFFDNKRDMLAVCEFACLHPENVREKALELLKLKQMGIAPKLFGTVAGRTPMARNRVYKNKGMGK